MAKKDKKDQKDQIMRIAEHRGFAWRMAQFLKDVLGMSDNTYLRDQAKLLLPDAQDLSEVSDEDES